MKKLFLSLAFITIGAGAIAQDLYVQGGLNLANITTSNSGETEDNKMLPTFNAGGIIRFDLSQTLDVETGLLFTGRGAKSETTFNNGDYAKAKFNPYYLELPLNVVFKIPLETNKSNVFFHAGPYVAMGIAGKSTFDSKVGPVEFSSSKNIKFSDDDPTTSEEEGAAFDRLKRFDYGLNVGGGIDFGKLMIKLNYGFGLAKINSTSTDNDANDKNKYRTLSISLGIPIL